MLALLVVLTMAFGATLATLPRDGSVSRRIRLGHRLLAATTLAVSVWSGATLLAGTAALVAGVGFLAARLGDDTWPLVLVFVHASGALMLLVVIGLQG